MSDTLAAAAHFELEVRRSRFLVHAAPIETPEQAPAFVAAAGDPAATHNCWACRIGQHYRFVDDGEPGGTAGRPILAAIDGQGFDRVVVLVTRWFGGVKLGAGGLVRAYGGSAAECLRRAPRQALVEMIEAELHCSFAHSAAVHALLAAADATKLAEAYDTQGLRLHLRLPAARFDLLSLTLRDATRGQGALRRA